MQRSLNQKILDFHDYYKLKHFTVCQQINTIMDHNKNFRTEVTTVQEKM